MESMIFIAENIVSPLLKIGGFSSVLILVYMETTWKK